MNPFDFAYFVPELNRREFHETLISSPLVPIKWLRNRFVLELKKVSKMRLSFTERMKIYYEVVYSHDTYNALNRKMPDLHRSLPSQVIGFISGIDSKKDKRELRTEIFEFNSNLFKSLDSATQKQISTKANELRKQRLRHKEINQEMRNQRRLELLRKMHLIDHEKQWSPMLQA